MKNRRWSILLYAVFLSVFLLAFFASFRSVLTEGLSDANSRMVSVRVVSLLSDAIARNEIEPNAFSSFSESHSFHPVDYDGRIKKAFVHSGIPYRFEIVSKAGSSSFWVYVGTGGTAVFEVFGSDGIPVSHATVNAGTEIEIPLPSTLTWTVNVVSLSSRSPIEIDRFGAEFRFSDSKIRAYRTVGKSEEYLGTYRSISD